MVSWLAAIGLLMMGAGTPEDYYQYSTTEFFDLSPVNQRIDVKSFDRELLEAAVFHASNEVRTKRRKSVYKFSPVLQKAARFHADYISEHKRVIHKNTRDKKYETPYKRIVAFGGDDFNGVAENLAMITPLKLEKDNMYFIKNGKPVDQQGNPFDMMTYGEMARQVVDGWMLSKGHRKNLMADYTYLGCGISDITFNKDGVPQVDFVQNFGYK